MVDAEGFVLIKEGAEDRVIATASYFITVIERVRAGLESVTQGFVAVELGAGEFLHVVEVQTSIGNFAAGFLLADQVRRDLVAPIKEGLRAALGGEFDARVARGAARGDA